MQCARHPKVETALSCGRCGTPICPRCAVSGPVGMRCPDCASLRSSHQYQINPWRFALSVALGLAAGTVVGFILQAISGFFMFFILFVGPAIGGAMGEVLLRASGRKRGLKLEILAGASVVVGAAFSELISGAWHHLLHDPLRLVLYLVAVGLTAAAAVKRMQSV